MRRRLDDSRGRIRLIGVLFFLAGFFIIYRLFNLQILSKEYYQTEANHQYIASSTKSPIVNRGTVYFRGKDNQLISAATVKEGFAVVINPMVLENPEEVYEKIAGIIPIGKEEFLRRASKKNDAFEKIAGRLEADKAEFIKRLNINGLDAIEEEWRFYPGGKLASHILGFVGYQNNDLVGQYGVEKYYEDFLRGTAEDTLGNSFRDAFLGLSREIFLRSLKKQDIVLTIEPRIQGFLEETIEKVSQEYSVESGGGLILDPKTGKILAMAATPDFDPNFYNKVENPTVFLNPLISSIFEMGSVMKPLTLSGGLDKKQITSETTYVDNGYLIIDQARVENYDGKARGKVDMQTVLNKSLNIGAVFAMRQLGKKDFQNYLVAFGLGEKTGIDLPDEVGGDIKGCLNTPREIECATASFGQGIALTPLGFATAFSSLANAGFLVQPYIVENDQNRPVIRRQVISKETSEEITRMLVRVVDEALLEGTVKMEHYSIAAKTGTAQIPKEDQRGYYENEYLHAFIGYAPAFDAKFLIFLYLKKPQGVRYAANSLTPAFMDIIKFLLNYYEIPPDR